MTLVVDWALNKLTTIISSDRGCSSVRESEFKSEGPGFDPLAGQGEKPNSFSVPPNQLLCRLVCA